MEADKSFEVLELHDDRPDIPRLCLSRLSPHSAVIRQLCFGDLEGPVVPGAPVFFLGYYGNVFGSRPSQVKQGTKVEHWYTDNKEIREMGNGVLQYVVPGMLSFPQIYIWREGQGTKFGACTSLRIGAAAATLRALRFCRNVVRIVQLGCVGGWEGQHVLLNGPVPHGFESMGTISF